jgi:hypothetical protein
MAILSTACLISVPLLNWSSTLRRLGATARDLKEGPLQYARDNYHSKPVDYKEESRDASEFGTRTVVIYWALLVTVGFSCIYFVGELGYGYNGNRTYYPISANVSKVQCTFGANKSIGLVTPDFVTANDCTNPCSFVANSELFRPLSDLVLLNKLQYNRFDNGGVGKESDVVNYYYEYSLWVFPYIILQGVWTACFGRRSPRQVRDKLWIDLTRLIPTKWPKTRTALRGLIGSFCGFVYLGAWLVVTICVPGVIFNIVVMELNLADTDLESEDPYMIGQWGPWCSTGLVLLAALIGRYHDPVTDGILSGFKRVWGLIPKHRRLQNGIRHHEDAHDPEGDHVLTAKTSNKEKTSALSKSWKSLKERITSFDDEWKNFYEWCCNPDEISKDSPRHPKSKPIPPEELSELLPHTPPPASKILVSHSQKWPANEVRQHSTQTSSEEHHYSQQHSAISLVQHGTSPEQSPRRKPLPSPHLPPVTTSTNLLV